MVSVGGNLTATIQKKTGTTKNEIGEHVDEWTNVGTVKGWLDYASGENGVSQYNAKIQDTTHYFIADVSAWESATQDAGITSENSRLSVNGKIYNVLMIDNPMELNAHIEVYLKYIGGGLGV